MHIDITKDIISTLDGWEDWMKCWTVIVGDNYSTYEPDNNLLYRGNDPSKAIESFKTSTFGN